MAQAKSLTDITFTITELTPIQQNDLPIEDDGFHLPTISENLMSRFKQLVGSMAESLQINNQNLVLYQLEQYRDNPSLAVFFFYVFFLIKLHLHVACYEFSIIRICLHA